MTMLLLKTAGGVALILLGLAMLVTPGPGLLALFGGISLLATEYEWARRWRDRLRARTDRLTHLFSKTLFRLRTLLPSHRIDWPLS